MKIRFFILFSLLLVLKLNLFAQYDVGFADVNLHPDVKKIITEIETKTGKTIQVNYGEFETNNNFTFGTSFINNSGRALVNIRHDLRYQAKKLEVVVTHELLHLKLRVNGFPVFLWSSTVKTAKGLAINTEQSTVNDLLSLIEHQVFKAEMEKYDLFKAFNLAGDTAKSARANKNKRDSQADSLNYARAILEYNNPADTEEVRKIFFANNWNRALKDGKQLAEIIQTFPLKTPNEVEKVFLRCLLILFPLPNSNYKYKLTIDAKAKFERQMIISITKRKG